MGLQTVNLFESVTQTVQVPTVNGACIATLKFGGVTGIRSREVHIKYYFEFPIFMNPSLLL